ncbi:MAG: hypothetical protein CML29_01370 [Rhizobiales bacterium]|nr:hypothetical protein [Hyphomicrobiales bacterium]MBA70308.1 hypothetical protein [Hyphomicrobiales bacterium]|tara:strand:- start:64 stop:1218 length:1155 start_codon:yes stop_codon:yes gene_type:complete
MQVSVKSEDNLSVLRTGFGDVRFESSAPHHGERSDFAAWAALPIAMRRGEDLVIDGRGDQVVAESAAKLSEIWELWMPHQYRRVGVSFTETSPMPKGEGRLILYSGGVDSTYNLLRHEAAGERPHLLTIHGLDYRYLDHERFQKLLDHTSEFANRVSAGRETLRSNIYQVYADNGVDIGSGHGFALFSSLFLFADRFAVGEISADYSQAQDFLTFPWGTNSVTNPYFRSSTFKIETGSADVTRASKLAVLARDGVALKALTLCKDSSVRPLNCGKCRKCRWTKARFLAVTGEIPDIFLNRELDAGSFAKAKLDSAPERAFIIDLFIAARSNGTLDRFPGFEQRVEKYLRKQRHGQLSRKRTMERRIEGLVKGWLKRNGSQGADA